MNDGQHSANDCGRMILNDGTAARPYEPCADYLGFSEGVVPYSARGNYRVRCRRLEALSHSDSDREKSTAGLQHHAELDLATEEKLRGFSSPADDSLKSFPSP